MTRRLPIHTLAGWLLVFGLFAGFICYLYAHKDDSASATSFSLKPSTYQNAKAKK